MRYSVARLGQKVIAMADPLPEEYVSPAESVARQLGIDGEFATDFPAPPIPCRARCALEIQRERRVRRTVFDLFCGFWQPP
jgi:hypothetical protein